MSNQESAKKKGLTKKRRKGLGLKRNRRHYPGAPNTLRSHELNLAHLRGVPSFLYPAPKPWQPPAPPSTMKEVDAAMRKLSEEVS